MNELNKVIYPEIYYDDFWQDIANISYNLPINSNILEIGSSTGEGSTSAFVAGISNNKNSNINLYCLEVSKERFEILKNLYSYDWFHPYNMSSINLKEFMTEEEVKSISKNEEEFNMYMKWRKDDIDYVLENNIELDAIDLIKKENNIDFFDCVLIDGSCFTAESELKKVYGSKIIMLDDVFNHIKNQKTFEIMNKDINYELVRYNNTLRCGYAIFIKK